MSDFRPYEILVTVHCSQIGPPEKHVCFLCAVDRATGERYASWNGCDSMSGSAVCTECHLKMIREFELAHPEFRSVV